MQDFWSIEWSGYINFCTVCPSVVSCTLCNYNMNRKKWRLHIWHAYSTNGVLPNDTKVDVLVTFTLNLPLKIFWDFFLPPDCVFATDSYIYSLSIKPERSPWNLAKSYVKLAYNTSVPLLEKQNGRILKDGDVTLTACIQWIIDLYWIIVVTTSILAICIVRRFMGTVF